MNKIRLSIILLSVVLTGTCTVIYAENSIDNTDNRKEIRLNNSERNLVLSEMRTFLSSIQQINQGLANNDMPLVIKSAKKSGKSAQAGMPATLVKKLPLAFKKLGGDTHAKFDQLAMDANDLGDRDHVLEQLSTLMKNCVGCHATYRISIGK